MINQEYIYQFLKDENWTELVDIFYKYKDFIETDTMLKKASATTVSVMVDKALKLETENDFIDNLCQLFLLNSGGWIKLDPEQNEAINIAIANAKKNNISVAYKYAKNYPNNRITSEIIKKYKQEFPTEIESKISNKIKATYNPINETEIDGRKSMFNSNQEVEFFIALKRVFDTFQIYPNVALSTIIDIDRIKDRLSKKEISFFYQTTIDFVVFEPFNNYEPVYFFEVDSPYHDMPEQIIKDKIKDKIFTLSGQKLFRIRKLDNSVTNIEFKQVLLEIRNLIK